MNGLFVLLDMLDMLDKLMNESYFFDMVDTVLNRTSAFSLTFS